MEVFEELNDILGTEYDSNKEINWSWVSITFNLSEQFIEKYQNKLNWIGISLTQKLSKEFIEKHKDRIDFEELKQNLLFQSDIGKDWFIAYFYGSSFKGNYFFYKNFVIDSDIIYKVKIYYKDLVTTSSTSKFIKLREIRKYKICGKKYGNISRSK